MKTASILRVFLAISIICACSSKTSKSDIEIEFVQDSLNVGYTYWWPESGPFIGLCGEELSLVFAGTVIDLEEANDDAGPLYTSQNGTIEINRVYKIKDLDENNYAHQKFITSDCFDGLELNNGDQVLVLCYDYENNYTIPGANSIIKITDFNDPLITSIRRYIDTDQNALKMKKDIGLWAKAGHGRKLQEIIECAEEMNSNSSS